MKIWMARKWFYSDMRDSEPFDNPELDYCAWLLKRNCEIYCNQGTGASDHYCYEPIQVNVRFVKWNKVQITEPVWEPRIVHLTYLGDRFFYWLWRDFTYNLNDKLDCLKARWYGFEYDFSVWWDKVVKWAITEPPKSSMFFTHIREVFRSFHLYKGHKWQIMSNTPAIRTCAHCGEVEWQMMNRVTKEVTWEKRNGDSTNHNG